MRLPAAIALILLTLSVVVTQWGQRFDETEHAQYQAALASLKQLDSGSRLELWRARFSLLLSYDELDRQQRQLREAVHQLQHIPGFVGPDARLALQELTQQQEHFLQRRQPLIEHLKSASALLAHTRRHLPPVLVEIYAGLGTREGDRALARCLEQIGRHVLLANAGHEDSSMSPVAVLQTWLHQYPQHREHARVRSLAQHLTLRLGAEQAVEEHLAEILKLPLASVTERMLEIYQAELNRALLESQGYRAALYVLGLGLVLLGVYTLWALRRANRNLARRVMQRSRQLQHSEERFRTLAETAPIGIFLTDRTGLVVYTNPRWDALSGLTVQTAIPERLRGKVHPADIEPFYAAWTDSIRRGQSCEGEVRLLPTEHANARTVRVQCVPVRTAQGSISGFVGTLQDVTAQRQAQEERRRGLVHEMVGRMTGGIAHELASSLQYINDRCHFLQDCLSELQEELDDGERAVADRGSEAGAAPTATQLPVLEHLNEAVVRAVEGVNRSAAFLRALQHTVQRDPEHPIDTDVHQLLEQTLMLARNNYKYVADLRLDLRPVPSVRAYPSALRQALLQLLLRAAGAVAGLVEGSAQRGWISVTLTSDEKGVHIQIHDNGQALPPPARHDAWDFASAATWSIVVDQHQGELDLQGRPGEGNRAHLLLPRVRPTTP